MTEMTATEMAQVQGGESERQQVLATCVLMGINH
jgi:bacteriocin-like protein